ncbi:magnesium transporter MgtE [Malaciobacter pacificus]|uniref:Magnesium transporter MgtE n=1 Tax=Malaciobacter pacificus TaxID=1080223 RepID=A0A5C2HB57_9BACT|nr:magnesium transporter [Malaciobacter pacificus]QEP35599.1 magnesium/cobalt/nickel transporter, MgtE family [Malaciobacter pacificus]GGD46023.1 magnesium transporter MgtE [Malaciobacter pacificus]
MENLKTSEELRDYFLQIIEDFKNDNCEIHPYDLAQDLAKLRDISDEDYEFICKKMPSDLFAEILCEMPNYVQEEISEVLSDRKIANITSKMDSDDASMLIHNISQNDEEAAQTILSKLDDEDKEIIERLNSYEDDVAGAYMQSELFKVKLDENIKQSLLRLKEQKENDELDNIFHAHIVDENNKFIGSIGLEELILFDSNLDYKDIPEDKFTNFSIVDSEDIKEAVEMFTHYNLSALAIVDDKNKLVGRITHDDIHDIIQQIDTKQLYSLAGTNDESEQEESMYLIGRNRALWLGVNLITAILASVVIGLFDATIQSLVALAVLMPIVASMGGNAGTQTLTVTVRQMALGEISYEDAKKIIYKEVVISLVNGFIFAFVIGVIAYLWFDIALLGVVIAISMVINLFSAGFFGAVIPIFLQKRGIDPAIGSTVILTTVTDVVGFFSFLGLATLILL